MVLSNREKTLLLLMGVLILGAVLYFAVRGLVGYKEGLEQRVDRQARLHAQVTGLRSDLRQLQAKPLAAKRDRPLIGYMEQLAARIAMKDRVQLNATRQLRDKSMEGVELKVNDLTIDELVKLLFAIENNNSHLIVDRLELTPAFRSKTRLRLTMRVLAFN